VPTPESEEGNEENRVEDEMAEQVPPWGGYFAAEGEIHQEGDGHRQAGADDNQNPLGEGAFEVHIRPSGVGEIADDHEDEGGETERGEGEGIMAEPQEKGDGEGDGGVEADTEEEGEEEVEVGAVLGGDVAEEKGALDEEQEQRPDQERDGSRRGA